MAEKGTPTTAEVILTQLMEAYLEGRRPTQLPHETNDPFTTAQCFAAIQAQYPTDTITTEMVHQYLLDDGYTMVRIGHELFWAAHKNV